MVAFMIRGLFNNLKYVYAQFPAASTKGHQLFVLLWKAIGRLTRLGFEVLAVTCDGAKNNRKMFSMHVSSGELPYKTTNIYKSTLKTIYFICDPPHVLKTIRNCFARGKLWVRILITTTTSVIIGHFIVPGTTNRLAAYHTALSE